MTDEAHGTAGKLTENSVRDGVFVVLSCVHTSDASP